MKEFFKYLEIGQIGKPIAGISSIGIIVTLILVMMISTKDIYFVYMLIFSIIGWIGFFIKYYYDTRNSFLDNRPFYNLLK